MSYGGKREGAGRKKGSTKRPQLRDYITEEEVKKLVKTAKEQAKDKPEILKFVLEHIFGKAPQMIDGNVAGEIRLLIAKEVADKHEITSDTSDSGIKLAPIQSDLLREAVG